MAKALQAIESNDAIIKKEAKDASEWFLKDYFTGSVNKTEPRATKTFEHASKLQHTVKKWKETEQ